MNNLLNKITDEMKLVGKISDVIRVVDPINMNSMIVKVDEIEGIKCIESKCHDFWKRNSRCNNCISMRALNKKDIFLKIEYTSNKVFLIMAIPCDIDGKTYILETLKDISKDRNIFYDKDNNSKLRKIIDEINDNTIIDKTSGLYNRDYIDERLTVDINNCITHGYPMSIIKVTIDYLRSIGYKYGKDIEEKLVADVASMFKELILNKSNWIGRYDTDSFLIVLNNENSITGILNILNQLFSNFTIRYNEIDTKVTTDTEVYSIDGINKNVESILEEIHEQFHGKNYNNINCSNGEKIMISCLNFTAKLKTCKRF
jgi:two-component system, cell cycle response regulator